MKRRLIGTVKSSLPSTLRVEIDRRMKHAKYGKIIRGRTVCHVHDASGEARPGDVVEIEEAPPTSRLKRWALIRVVTRPAVVEAAE
ncbi:MAG: ribosomal protein [Planctomycetota bacterium]|jgi:small subunit ribosomal protein S17